MRLVFVIFLHTGGLRYIQETHPSAKEGDVIKGGIGVDELEGKQFDDQSIVILGLSPVVLYKT